MLRNLPCSTTANCVCSTRLTPTSLKTINNRFLYARCPLRVQVPPNARKRKESHFRETLSLFFWSEWRDLNPRPLRPERSTLPNCATPRRQKAFFLNAQVTRAGETLFLTKIPKYYTIEFKLSQENFCDI